MDADAEHLYIRVLVWAYQQGSRGFTWKELGKALALTNEQTKWVENTLYLNMQTNESLFNRLGDTGSGENRFCLSGRGITTTIQYLQLVEAEKTGRRAQWIAIASIFIGALVGIAQIITTFFKP